MLKPLGDRVVLKIEEKRTNRWGALSLQAQPKKKTKTAQVVATGQGVRTLNGDLLLQVLKLEIVS